MSRDDGRLRPELQEKKKNKIAFKTKITPFALHWYKGKLHVFVPTYDGMLVIDGGQVVGKDKKGNFIIEVGPEDGVTVVGPFGVKGMSGKEFRGRLVGDGLADYGQDGTPVFTPGYPAPDVPGATSAFFPENDDYRGWEPPALDYDLSDWEPSDIRVAPLPPPNVLDAIAPHIPDMDPDIDGDRLDWVYDMHSDQADESNKKEIDPPFYRHEVFDNYYKHLQEFRDNDMLEEDDEDVVQDNPEFEMEM